MPSYALEKHRDEERDKAKKGKIVDEEETSRRSRHPSPDLYDEIQRTDSRGAP